MVTQPEQQPAEKGYNMKTVQQPGSIQYQFLYQKFIQFLPIIFLVIVLTFLAFHLPIFYKTRNLINIITQASTLGVMAIGMTVVLIVGGIDLSIPGVMGLSAVLGATIMKMTGNPFIGACAMLVIGVLIGILNGIVISYFKMVPLVVTLAISQITYGTCIFITGMSALPVPFSFVDVILFRMGRIPLLVFIFIAFTILATIFTKKSIFGRWLYAVGTNLKTARVCGVPSDRVVFGAYVFSGFCAGLTAILLSARLMSATHHMADINQVLGIVSSCVVGGVSIYGGKGSPLGAALGAIFMTVIANTMNLMRVDFFASIAVTGAIIIAFVYLDSLRNTRR